jgi:hypothetical protein
MARLYGRWCTYLGCSKQTCYDDDHDDDDGMTEIHEEGMNIGR